MYFPLLPKAFTFFFSAYAQLNVKHEPLQLITPQFETPLPQLQPAVSYRTEMVNPTLPPVFIKQALSHPQYDWLMDYFPL